MFLASNKQPRSTSSTWNQMCLSESTTKSSPSTTLVASMMTSTHIWGLRLSSSLESKNKTYLETQELKTLFCLSTISTIPTWLTNLRYLEKMGRERNPKFNISWIHFGLSGGSYYRPLIWRCSRLRSIHFPTETYHKRANAWPKVHKSSWYCKSSVWLCTYATYI